jgi:hypothetical protein
VSKINVRVALMLLSPADDRNAPEAMLILPPVIDPA